MHDQVADGEQDPRRERERAAQLLVDPLELGNDEDQHRQQDQADEPQDHDRVGHGRLDPLAEGHFPLHVGGQPLQDRLQHAAGLSRADHGYVKVVEHLGVLGHGRR